MSDSPIIVIGGGPAGSCVSTLLARRGYPVMLLEREHFPRNHVGESLLPASIPILQDLGVLDRVRQAGFVLKRGATMIWGVDPGAVELVLQRDQRLQPAFVPSVAARV